MLFHKHTPCSPIPFLNGETTMDTYFALPEKACEEELADQIELVTCSPLVSGLLHSISGVLAILNEQRQILAVNDAFLKMLGIDDPHEALGLRPGEAVKCIHAEDEPAGCGTTKFCASCGAAVAMVTSLRQNCPAERICALTARQGSRNVEMALWVKSQPITIEDKKFLLLLLQDVTLQQHRAALERTFFHDVNNLLAMMVQASELLLDDPSSDQAETIYQAANRLHREVDIQRCLSESGDYQPVWYEYTLHQIFSQLEAFFINHPARYSKHVEFSSTWKDHLLKTDISALLRVLSNMIINALEASDKNEVVKVWVELEKSSVNFYVWNHRPIPEEITFRIFQRNFSTKKQAGRGIGTYSMKLFGEKILGGQVGFTSSPERGTLFRLAHPIYPPA